MNGHMTSPGYTGMERRKNGVLPYFGEERRVPPARNRALDDETFLVQRARKGERAAFAQLYDRHVDKVFKYIYFNVGDRVETEQLTARAFLTAWKTIGDQASPPSFSSWMYRVAHQVIGEHRRSQTTAPIPQPEKRDSLQPSANALLTMLRRLDDEQREVLVLRLIAGFGTDQVTQILGQPGEAVTALQHRALAGLGEILREDRER